MFSRLSSPYSEDCLRLLRELSAYASRRVRGAIISGSDFSLLAGLPMFSGGTRGVKHGFEYFFVPDDAAMQFPKTSGESADMEGVAEIGMLEYIVSAKREMPRILTNLDGSLTPESYSPDAIPLSYTLEYALRRFEEDKDSPGKLLLGALPRSKKYTGRFADTLPLADLLKLYLLSMSDKTSPEESYDASIVAGEFRRRILLIGKKGKGRLSAILRRLSNAENLESL